eukprot:TRINITY_DN6472_c0_g1_i1.p1 TRINITY_DN6472_c0_g1~~TRINITY_DN6472_c0_g1_i1.p1  ORF type:complete len:713 (-),score=167.58 TRINITY_DN6472_c0_g1_i1:18-2156(-)
MEGTPRKNSATKSATPKDAKHIQEELEKAFGKSISANQIWLTYKSSGYDVEKTLELLNSQTGKKIQSEQIEKPKKATPRAVQQNEDTKRNPTKKKLRTSEEVFNRMRWDHSFDKDEILIGYEDRFDGMKEALFVTWEAKDVTEETFIPWHRVQYFKHKGEVVWDRKTRMDKVFVSGVEQPSEEPENVDSETPVSDNTNPIIKQDSPQEISNPIPLPKLVSSSSPVNSPPKSVSTTVEKQKLVTSSLVIIPPPQVWETIQEIRKVHDTGFVRWMPHINLLYPFLPVSQFPAAASKIERALRDFAPFTIKLEKFLHFDHRKYSTLWLNPETEQDKTIHKLQKILENQFPICDDLSRISQQGFTPHLSVGNDFSKEHIEGFKNKFQINWKPIEFQVNELYLIHRQNDDPFQIHSVVPLGKKVNSPNKKESKQRDNGIPFFRFSSDNNGWVQVEPNSEDVDSSRKTLSIVSYNILFNQYSTDKIYSKVRYPILNRILEQTGADLICLQEVERMFLDIILKEKWVQDNYYASDRDGTTLLPYGQLLLSKIPISRLSLRRESGKIQLISEFKVNGKDVVVPVVHLSSNRSQNANQKRENQLYSLFEQINSFENRIIVGDLNFGDGEEQESIQWGDYQDAWLSLCPGQAGYTFDPEVNTLAKLNSSTGLKRRFDRVIVGSPNIVPQSIQQIGTTSFEHDGQVLFPSDHYGILCELNFQQ